MEWQARLSRIARATRPHLPEGAAFFVGVLLRLRLADSYGAQWGWDVTPHLQYIENLAEKGERPALDAFRTAYHPPLYYWLSAQVLRAGGTLEGVQWISIGAGIAGLALLWVGLRRALPGDRMARAVALLLAAVLPCAIHVQGMLGNEALLAPFVLAALLLLHETFGAAGARRWRFAVASGLALGLALLVKVSALVIIPAIALGALLELPKGNMRAAVARAAPFVATIAVALVLYLPVQWRHVRASGRLFPSGYDALGVEPASGPYFARRPAGYLLDPCIGPIVARPFYPTCIEPSSRFWPVCIASTFGDYYSYRYAGDVALDEPALIANGHSIPAEVVPFQRASVAAGFAIAAVTAAATLALAVNRARARDAAAVLLVSVPIIAVLGQIHFAYAFPYDGFGPIKGSYLQFAAPPMFAAFGIAVSHAWARPRTRALAVLALLAVATVLAYSLVARARSFS